MLKKVKETDYHIWLVLMLSAFLRIICYLRGVDFTFRTDDFGTLIYPAYIAGYDWSSFVSGLNNYYGYGYYWVFFGFFKFISTPEHVIIAINAVNACLIVLSSVLAYHILVSQMEMPRSLPAVFMAVIPTLFMGDVASTTSTMWYRTDNEIPMYFICWLLVWAILRARDSMGDDLKKRVFYSCITALLMAWSLTVHERAMSLVLAVMLIEIFLAVLKRKWLFQPVALFGTFAVGYYIHKIIRRHIIATFWAERAIHNTDAFSSISLWFLESWTSLKAFFMLFIGNWHSVFVKTYGLACIGVVIVIAWVLHEIFCRVRCSKIKKETAGTELEKDNFIDPHTLIIMIFGLTVLIVITGLSVRWGDSIYEGLLENKLVYHYKGICYSRYYYSFLGPVSVAVLTFLYKKGKCPLKMAIPAWLLLLLTEGLFVFKIYPHCLQMGYKTIYIRAMNVMVSHGGHQFVISMLIMVICIALLTFTSISLPILNRISYHKIWLLIPLIIVAANFQSRIIDIDLSNMTFHFKYGTEIREALYEIEESDKGLPEEIYVDLSVAKKRIKFTLQFSLKNQTFIHGLPQGEDLGDDNIVITSSPNPGLNEAGYSEVKMAGYYLYTNDNDYLEIFKNFQ